MALHDMDELQDYAEQYSVRERIQLVSLYGIFGLAFVVASRQWLFPWIRWFAETAPCHELLGYSGTTWLAWGLFVGLPVLSGLIVTATLGRMGYRIVRDRRAPPRAVKVFRKTRIVRGQPAILRGYMALLAGPVVFFSIAIWGSFQAVSFEKSIDASGFDHSVCTAFGNSRTDR